MYATTFDKSNFRYHLSPISQTIVAASDSSAHPTPMEALDSGVGGGVYGGVNGVEVGVEGGGMVEAAFLQEAVQNTGLVSKVV